MTIKYSAKSRQFARFIHLDEVQGSQEWEFSDSFSWVDQVSSLDVPGYRRKIARSEQATSYRSGERQSVYTRPGVIAMTWQTSPDPESTRTVTVDGYLLTDIGFGSLPPTSGVSEAENQARERFYSNYRKQYNAFQGGTAMGEMGEALRMLRSPAKALRERVGKLYSKMLKSKSVRDKKLVARNRYLSQTWLEGTFGWKPLINDVEGALEALAFRGRWMDRQVMTISGHGYVESETFLPGLARTGYSNVSLHGSAKESKTTMVRYKGAIRCEASNPFIPPTQYWGFDPTTIVPTVWELMPYSFLIDYFSNIGKVIDAYSMRRCRLSWGVRTTRRTAIRQFVDGYNNSNTNVYAVLGQYFAPGDWKATKSAFIREPIDTVPIPTVDFKVPGFDSKWINIAALARVKSTKLLS